MAFKDLINKGMDAISKGAESAKNAAMEKKQAMQNFDILKTTGVHIGPTNLYEVKNPEPQVGKEQQILASCLTINVENSKIINQLIPIDETILNVKTATESKTEMKYAFVATDKRLWIANKNEYVIYEYGNIPNFEIINKGMMGQGVKFDDKAFLLDGSENDINILIQIVMNNDYRAQETTKKIAYLCGATPIKQLLNMNMSGITFADNGMLVLHNGTDNRVVDPKDITTVQLLLNDTVVLSKGKEDSGNFMSSPLEARKMDVKIVFTNGEYIIEILKQNMMNTSYKREDSTYSTNFEFGKQIVETLADYIKNNYELKTTEKPVQAVPVIPSTQPVEPPTIKQQPITGPNPFGVEGVIDTQTVNAVEQPIQQPIEQPVQPTVQVQQPMAQPIQQPIEQFQQPVQPIPPGPIQTGQSVQPQDPNNINN